MALVLLASLDMAAAAAGETATVCAVMGDRFGGRPDVDTFSVFDADETMLLTLEARSDPRNAGTVLQLRGPGARARGDLPLAIEVQERKFGVVVKQAGKGASRFAGAYCLRAESTGDSGASLEPTDDVEVDWVALAADRSSVFPPFMPVASGDWAGAIQPIDPLVGGRQYGFVVTKRVRDHDGLALQPDEAFQSLLGVRVRDRAGPIALFAADPEAPDNPYPDTRLVRGDGTIRVPDRVVWRGLDASDPALDAARADLRATADGLERLTGFGTVQPITVALSRPVDLATVTPASVLFVPLTGGADLDGLLRTARRQGIRKRDVALAITFPTADVELGHRALRHRIDALASSSPFGAVLDDPDPFDDLPIGLFGRSSLQYGAYLAANPEIAAVVVGLLPSREFRGPDGQLDYARLDGTAKPPVAPLDFVLALPSAGAPPYPVVVFQHGFGGSNGQVLTRVGPALAAHGLAVIGINAASHGRRGSPIDLLTGSAFQLRDIFRQTNADQMALVRMIQHGVDVDGDGESDLDASRVGYLGISLGGLAGGPLIAHEPAIGAAVLNVMSGRTSLNGLNAGTRPIFTTFLAEHVGLPIDSPAFEAYLAQSVALGQHAADAADSLNAARRWTRRPFPGTAPRRVLVQEGVGDDLVWNSLTEELAMVAGLPTNVPASDVAGVSGHWIFQPPGGHGIFERADVQDQAATFLASGGTELIDP